MTLPEPEEWPDVDLPPLSCGEMLAERVASTPARTAIVDDDRETTWSYADFADRVSGTAAQILPETLAVGDRVGLLAESGTAFATTVFAVWHRGCVAVLLDPRRDEDALADQVRRADVGALVASHDHAGTARTVTPPGVSVETLPEEVPAPTGEAPDPASEGPEKGDASPNRADRSPDDDHLVLFTSGTTGRPKGVRLTAANLVASAAASARRLGVTAGDRWLACLPMCHVGGLAPLVRSTLYGTTTVLQRGFDVDGTARALGRREATCVSLVPTMLTRLLDDGWSPSASLRFVLLGGGPVAPSLVDRCADRGVPVCPTYGTTETASQVATAAPATATAHPGTVGPPLPGVDVTVLDDGACDHGEVGELVVDGPVVTPGYLDADATRSAFGERGFHTGDLGYRDGDGNLWIEGRADDVIRTGGETVQPWRVADALEDLDGVDAAAVVGIADPEWGERVAALVVPEDGTTEVSAAAIRDALRGRVAEYAVPKTVAVVDALPRTASGTVDRDRARERLV